MSELDGYFKLPKPDIEVDSIVVLLHGLGADGNDLIGVANLLAEQFPTTAFYSPDAPTPYHMGGLGYQWFSINQRNFEETDEIIESSHLINDYIDKLLDRHILKARDCVLIGFSQGSMMALYAGLRRKEQLAGLVGISGALIAKSTLNSELRSSPPVLLIHGEDDFVVNPESSKEAANVLKDLGINAHLHLLTGLGHSIDLRSIQLINEFLRSIFSR